MTVELGRKIWGYDKEVGGQISNRVKARNMENSDWLVQENLMSFLENNHLITSRQEFCGGTWSWAIGLCANHDGQTQIAIIAILAILTARRAFFFLDMTQPLA